MRYWLEQVGRALSRLLNAVAGGEGDCTFSAWSWHLKLRGKPTGALRVAVVDALSRQEGHCRRAYEWHAARGLIQRD